MRKSLSVLVLIFSLLAPQGLLASGNVIALGCTIATGVGTVIAGGGTLGTGIGLAALSSECPEGYNFTSKGAELIEQTCYHCYYGNNGQYCGGSVSYCRGQGSSCYPYDCSYVQYFCVDAKNNTVPYSKVNNPAYTPLKWTVVGLGISTGVVLVAFVASLTTYILSSSSD